MGNTKGDKVTKEKTRFISLLMKHGYTLKEAQKEYLSHQAFINHAQQVADMTGKPITIVTEIVLDQPLTVAVEGKDIRRYATNKTKGQTQKT